MADFSTGFAQGFGMAAQLRSYKMQKEAAAAKAEADRIEAMRKNTEAVRAGAKQMMDTFDWLGKQPAGVAEAMFDTVVKDIIPGFNAKSPGWKSVKKAFTSQQEDAAATREALQNVLKGFTDIQPDSPLAAISGTILRKMGPDPMGAIKLFNDTAETVRKLDESKRKNQAISSVLGMKGPSQTYAGAAGLPPALANAYNVAMQKSETLAEAGLTEQANYYKSMAENIKSSPAGVASTAAARETGSRQAGLQFVGPEARLKAQAEANAVNQTQITPRQAKILGEDPTNPPTPIELAQKGKILPTEDQLTELQEGQFQATIFQKKIGDLVKNIEFQPEKLGLVGGTVRLLGQGAAAIRGFARAFGAEDPGLEKLGLTQQELDDRLRGLDGIATKSQVARSQLIDLAYNAARVIGGETGRLSRDDVLLYLDALGKSQDPQQFAGALRSMSYRAEMAYQEKFRTYTGDYSRPLGGLAEDLNTLSDDDLMGLDPVLLSDEQTRALREELLKRRAAYE